MKNILFCPNCGRCLGESSSLDENWICKILTKPPYPKKHQFILKNTCKKCKTVIYMALEFKTENQ